MTKRIQISERGRRKLERLQVRLRTLTSKRVRKPDLIDLVLELGPDPNRLAARVNRMGRSISSTARQRILERNLDWGVGTCEEEINGVLYRWGE
jgi:hypothetical protein